MPNKLSLDDKKGTIADIRSVAEVLKQDQKFHNFTEQSSAVQMMTTSMRHDLEIFYDLYQLMVEKGEFDEKYPIPGHILDFSNVKALCHRLEAFLSFKRLHCVAQARTGLPSGL
ncbi:hypothetical protein V8E36_001208 [Tilletia maclaganii]